MLISDSIFQNDSEKPSREAAELYRWLISLRLSDMLNHEKINFEGLVIL